MIKIVDLYKRFDDRWVTRGVNLEIPKGQMTCIVGQSGEGKSVLLKQIIGLLEPTSGHIYIDDVDVTSMSWREKEKYFKRIGYVFQFAALLDSLTIFENIGITLLEQDKKCDEVRSIVKEKLRLVNLEQDVLNRYPAEISGGMRKRVGLARTLITNPEIILYDEPTTGLDPITARIIHELMFEMQQQLSLTSVIVTHDVDLFNYADNVAVLANGQIRYFGDAKTAWESDNPYIYQFVRGLTAGPILIE